MPKKIFTVIGIKRICGIQCCCTFKCGGWAVVVGFVSVYSLITDWKYVNVEFNFNDLPSLKKLANVFIYISMSVCLCFCMPVHYSFSPAIYQQILKGSSPNIRQDPLGTIKLFAIPNHSLKFNLPYTILNYLALYLTLYLLHIFFIHILIPMTAFLPIHPYLSP